MTEEKELIRSQERKDYGFSSICLPMIIYHRLEKPAKSANAIRRSGFSQRPSSNGGTIRLEPLCSGVQVKVCHVRAP